MLVVRLSVVVVIVILFVTVLGVVIRLGVLRSCFDLWFFGFCWIVCIVVLVVVGIGVRWFVVFLSGCCVFCFFGSFFRFFWVFYGFTVANISDLYFGVLIFGLFMVIVRSVWSIWIDNLFLSFVLRRFIVL